MSQFTYAELFAGAGGLSMGLELAGWEPIAHAEIEPHARAVLRYHWPECRLDGDVSAINGSDYAGVTLLSGGSPCQDLSVAGKRNGMTEGSGTRSSLYFEQVRIWNESGAPYFLWENVLGAFSSNNGRDFAAVLSALVGAAVPVPANGWESAGVAAGPTGVAAWRVLDCQYFGPPQRRRRVFVLGARTRGVDPAEVLAVSEGVFGHLETCGQASENAAADIGSGTDATRRQSGVATTQYGDIAGTLAARGDGSACADRGPNMVAVADAVFAAYPIDTRNATRTTEKDEQNRQGSGIGDDGDPSPTLTGLFTPAVVAFDNRPQVNQGGPVDTLTTEGARNPLSVVTFTPGFLTRGEGPRPSEEVVQTLGANTQGDQAPHIVRVFGVSSHGGYIAADGGDNGGGSENVAAVCGTGTGIPRRLMPVECERLMGWPDQHTATGVDEQGRTYALSDTARYRLCGNGVASPVAGWIAWRLRWAMERQAASIPQKEAA